MSDPLLNTDCKSNNEHSSHTLLPFNISGQKISQLCKQIIPGYIDEVLLDEIGNLTAQCPVHLVMRGDDWYRIGGVIDKTGNRVAKDIIEWVDRTYIESGHNFQVLIDYALQHQFIATRISGTTLYFTIETGPNAEDFILLEIDKINEVADRLLINPNVLPEEQEDIIDPIEPAIIESFNMGQSRYVYRRKTDIKLFLETLSARHIGEHPAQRFINDWNRSSAHLHKFCHEWIIRPYQHTGRYGEQIINAEVMNVTQKQLPFLEDLVGKQGSSLNNLLSRFDRKAGYPFAWYFYMVKGKLVSPYNGEAVYKDITGDFAYLPKRDEEVLKDWVTSPYKI